MLTIYHARHAWVAVPLRYGYYGGTVLGISWYVRYILSYDERLPVIAPSGDQSSPNVAHYA